MKIITYTSTDAPPSHAAVARFLMDGGFLPVVVNAPDEEQARAKAQTFWDTERARLQGGGKPRGALDVVASEEPCFECGSTERIGTACKPCNPEISDPSFGADPMDELIG